MLSAIQLDDKPLFLTNEIRNILPDGLLSSKFEACHSMSAQLSPGQPFGIGGAVTEFFGQIIVQADSPPLPVPLPRWGEGTYATPTFLPAWVYLSLPDAF